MATRPELTESEILQKMRDHVNAQRPGAGDLPLPAGSSPPPAPGMNEQRYDLGRLRHAFEVVSSLAPEVAAVGPRRKGLEEAIRSAKKVIRSLLSWFIRSVQQFNAAVVRALQEQVHALESMQHQIDAAAALHQKQITVKSIEIEAMRRHIDSAVAQQHTQIARLGVSLDELRKLHIEERLRSSELKLRRWQSRQSSQATRSPQAANSHVQTAGTPGKDFDYFLFQEYYRGSEALIRDRQQSYLKYFEGREPIWDLGCGRGEFLKLLSQHGSAAQGVDNSPDAVHLCREKGLEVIETDVFAFLEASADQSAGGIFAAQLIEHLPVELQLRLVDLCFEKLRPAAPLVLETINPECLFALARNFYLDPTHVRPVHPDLLRFVVETRGFCDVQVEFSGPVEGKYLEKPSWSTDASEQAITAAIMNLNHFAFGFQDYALIAWRP